MRPFSNQPRDFHGRGMATAWETRVQVTSTLSLLGQIATREVGSARHGAVARGLAVPPRGGCPISTWSLPYLSPCQGVQLKVIGLDAFPCSTGQNCGQGRGPPVA